MNVQLQVALFRARLIAKREFNRAVQLVQAAGVALNEAVHRVLNILRSLRTA